jgi:hypothetical protein
MPVRAKPTVPMASRRSLREEVILIVAEGCWELLCRAPPSRSPLECQCRTSGELPSGSISQRARPLAQKQSARGVPVQPTEEP